MSPPPAYSKLDEYDAKANYIVSGDRHLLNLKNFKGLKIVNVKEMLKFLKKK